MMNDLCKTRLTRKFNGPTKTLGQFFKRELNIWFWLVNELSLNILISPTLQRIAVIYPTLMFYRVNFLPPVENLIQRAPLMQPHQIPPTSQHIICISLYEYYILQQYFQRFHRYKPTGNRTDLRRKRYRL